MYEMGTRSNIKRLKNALNLDLNGDLKMTLKIRVRVAPKILWDRKGDITVASGNIEVISEEVIGKSTITSELNTKGLMTDEAAAFFQKDLRKKINEALREYKERSAVETSFDDELEDAVQSYMDNKINLEGNNSD